MAFAFVRFGQGQRQFADAAQQPLRVASSGNVIGQDPGIELVFGVSDVFGQRVIRMIDMYLHFDLAQHLARIELFGDQMHARPAMRIACRNGPRMRVETRIFG